MASENYILKLSVASQYHMEAPRSEEEIKNSRKVLSAEIIGKLVLAQSLANENKKVIKYQKCETGEIIEGCTLLDIRSPYAWAADAGKRDKNIKKSWKNVILMQKYWLLECPRELLEKKVIWDDDKRYYAGLCRIRASDLFQTFNTRYPAYYATPEAFSENCMACVYTKSNFSIEDKTVEFKDALHPITRYVFIKDDTVDRIYGPYRWYYSSGKLVLETQIGVQKLIPREYQINIPFYHLNLGEDTYEIASFYGAQLTHVMSEYEEKIERDTLGVRLNQDAFNKDLIALLNKNNKAKKKSGGCLQSNSTPGLSATKAESLKTDVLDAENEQSLFDDESKQREECLSDNAQSALPCASQPTESMDAGLEMSDDKMLEALDKIADAGLETEFKENATSADGLSSLGTDVNLTLLDKRLDLSTDDFSANRPTTAVDKDMHADSDASLLSAEEHVLHEHLSDCPKKERVDYSVSWTEPEKTIAPDISNLIGLIYRAVREGCGNLAFSMTDAANLALCVSQNLLTIITGRPGCGKTSFVRQISNALGLTHPEFKRFHEVQVCSDWRSSRDLFGYYNPVNGQFEGTALYRSLKSYEAFERNHNYPYWILLDDANMSPLEGYLSDFRGVQDIDLASSARYHIETGGTVSGDCHGVDIPSSLRLIATFSDDYSRYYNMQMMHRAWVISLPEVSGWDNIFGKVANKIPEGTLITQDALDMLCTTGLSELGTDDECGAAGRCYCIYCSLVDILKILNITLQKGAWTSIRRYCYAAKTLHLMEDEVGQNDEDKIILDYVISQRILPMVHQSGKNVRGALNSLLDKYGSMLPISSAIITDIIARGDVLGFYSFFDRR